MRRDRKAERQRTAIERQAAAAERTVEEQMTVLEERGQAGGPEFAKLQAKLNKQRAQR